jgi:hypothetical protein
MITNFTITQNYALDLKGKHLDLHNDFDFAGFSFDNTNRHLTLKWIKGQGDWVPTDNPSVLKLAIEEVSYLKILPRNESDPFTEDTCVMDISYYPSSDRQEDELLMDKDIPDTSDDLIVRFQGGQVIRVKGNSIHCLIE